MTALDSVPRVHWSCGVASCRKQRLMDGPPSPPPVPSSLSQPRFFGKSVFILCEPVSERKAGRKRNVYAGNRSLCMTGTRFTCLRCLHTLSFSLVVSITMDQHSPSSPYTTGTPYCFAVICAGRSQAVEGCCRMSAP